MCVPSLSTTQSATAAARWDRSETGLHGAAGAVTSPRRGGEWVRGGAARAAGASSARSPRSRAGDLRPGELCPAATPTSTALLRPRRAPPRPHASMRATSARPPLPRAPLPRRRRAPPRLHARTRASSARPPLLVAGGRADELRPAVAPTIWVGRWVLAVGEGTIWVSGHFDVEDPYDEMGLIFGLALLEIALAPLVCGLPARVRFVGIALASLTRASPPINLVDSDAWCHKGNTTRSLSTEPWMVPVISQRRDLVI